MVVEQVSRLFNKKHWTLIHPVFSVREVAEG